MIDYDEMSDFKINKLISSLVDFGSMIVATNDASETVYLCDKDGLFEMVPISYFDPCNNPADMWPIILESDITVSPSLGAWLHDGKPHGYNNDAYDAGKIFESTDKNPLRAAAIVYLMMKDAK